MQNVRADATALRWRLEVAIERAIAALDALDGDSDLEPGCEDEGFDSDTELDQADNG